MTRSQRVTALVLLAALNAFGFIDRVVVALVAEKVKAEFLISDLEIGLLGGTLFAVVNTLASVPIARLAERFNRARITAGFLLMGSAFTALAGVAGSFVHLMVARLGMAMGSAATEAPPHSMISDIYPPEKRASAISIYMLGIPVAALFGSFLGGTIAEAMGWRSTFLFFGFVGALISLLCFVFLKEPARSSVHADTHQRMSAWQVLGILLRSRKLTLMTAGVTLVSLGSFGVNTFLPAHFSRSFGLDAGKAGLTFGLVSGLASLAGTLIGGFGAERLAKRDPRWLLGFPALGLVLGAPVFLLGASSQTLGLAVPLLLLGSMTIYTSMGPAIATLHGSLDSFSRATGSAIFLLIMHMIGQGLGPPLVGMVSDAASAMAYGGGDFAANCKGAAGQVAGSSCAVAAASGLRNAISAFALFFIIAGSLLFFASRAPAPRG